MARVLVVSDDGATIVPIVLVGEDEDWAEGVCPCGEIITDRGHFEDTVQAVQVHLDNAH